MNPYIPIVFALVALFSAIPLLPSRLKGHAMIAAIILNVAVSAFWAVQVLAEQPVEWVWAGNAITGPIPIRMDGLSAWFILTVDFVFLMGAFYGNQYMKGYQAHSSMLSLHFMAMVVLHSAMLMVLVVQNSFVFLVFWEIMALSAFVAIIFEHQKITTLKAGLNYLIQSHLSIVVLMLAFIWVASKTGSFDFKAIQAYVQEQHHLVSVALFLMMFVGFGIKAGFVPFHTWLPHAHPAAPAHISGIMSGIVVKMGIYGILRMVIAIKSDFLSLGVFLVIISVGGGIFGILNAALHRDMKRMLAYCTIENIGIIGIGIGVGLTGIAMHSQMLYILGFGGALLHVLNHALFKSLMFFSVGSVYLQTHNRDMDQLGGLVKLMPFTALFFLVGAVSIGGLPPFNGFFSEFLLYNALAEGIRIGDIGLTIVMVLTMGGLAIIGGLSILTFTKTFGMAFLGEARHPSSHKPREVSWQALWPQLLLVVAMMTVVVFPRFYMQIALKALNVDLVAGNAEITHIPDLLGQICAASGVVVGVGLVIWFWRKAVSLRTSRQVGPTWGCGYTSPTPKIQYTGKSFSKTLGKVFGFMAIEEKHYRELEENEVFPGPRKYVSHYLDFFEHRLIDPLVQRLLYTANYFQFIQNGKVQWYLLYGILFVVSVFVLTYLSDLLRVFQTLYGTLAP